MLPPQIDHTAQTLKNKFTEVYEKNLFGGHSSPEMGSGLKQTEIIRSETPKIIKDFKIKTLLDAPCGDWYWMQKVDLGVDQYIGCDIVEPLIAKNTEKFGSDKVKFQTADLSKDSLPTAELIFSRDLLVHLNFEDAFKVMATFKKSGAKYLLTTTFINIENNSDLIDERFLPDSSKIFSFSESEILLYFIISNAVFVY